MIFELLQPGEDTAKTARELSKTTGLGVREVMQAVRAERLAGLPICGTCKGFFTPATDAELAHTISRLYKQARETRKVAEALKSARGAGNERKQADFMDKVTR